MSRSRHSRRFGARSTGRGFDESIVAAAADDHALSAAVVPGPETPSDWLRMWAVTLSNTARWRQHATLDAWLMQCRLSGPAAMARGVRPDDAPRMAPLEETGVQAGAAAAKLPALMTML